MLELHLKAEKLLSEKNWEELLSVSSEVIKLAPEDDKGYTYHGIAKGNLGDHNSTINDCNKAIEINPKSQGAYVTRGIAKGNLGDHKGAIEDFDKALEIDPYYTQAIHNRGASQAFVVSQKEQEKTIKELNEKYEEQLKAQFKDTGNELFHANHYKNEKEKYENQFDNYSNKKRWAMCLLIVIVLIIACALAIYLYYLISYKSNEWKLLSFFPALAIVSLSLFPLIWLIRNIEHDRIRCWAMGEDMHTKWIFILSIRHPSIPEEKREKILLQFLEHLNNSNTPNIILSKDIGDKNDLISMAKNFILKKNKE